MPTDVLPWLARRIIGMALFGLVLSPTGVMAHAILEQSQPPADGSVRAGRVDMSFTYNSRIDGADPDSLSPGRTTPRRCSGSASPDHPT